MRTLFAVALILPIALAAPALAQRGRPTTPPVREVRDALARLAPTVQQCAVLNPPPGSGTTRRLRIRVWLQPNARYTMEVPELTARVRDPGIAQLHACLSRAVAIGIRPALRPFRGSSRIKAERSFTVRVPGPPPPAAELARRVLARRTQLAACVPGSGPRGSEVELLIRANLTTHGTMELVGLGVPDTVTAPFEPTVECVRRELAAVAGERVTSAASFEARVPFRYTAPAAPPPAPPPPAPDPQAQPQAQPQTPPPQPQPQIL